MVRLFIRGKPWVVSVDDNLFLYDRNEPKLFFTKSDDMNAMWAPIVEKAWAKVKGNYIMSEGGHVENGIHSLTGFPVIRYQTSDLTSQADFDKAFDKL